MVDGIASLTPECYPLNFLAFLFPQLSLISRCWLNAENMAAQAALIADTIMGMKRALRKEQDCELSLFF